MIKLKQLEKPVELTLDLQKRLTDEFKSTGKPVWNLPFLKTALLKTSNNKCCYCETDISEESKYLEVEHFHHKDRYPNEVLEWENLLPSCKRCNGTKGAHDTISEPIINPTINNPNQHLKFWNFRIKAIDELGEMTISALNLNSQDRLVIKRFEIGSAIQIKLEQLNHLMKDVISEIQDGTRRKNIIINGLKDLLKEGLPTSIYSTTCATVILNDKEYYKLKGDLIKKGLWDKNLDDLEAELQKIAFELDI